MLKKIFIYLIGAHYYYPYLFFKNVNKDTTPQVGAVIYSAKNIGVIIASLYYLISGDTEIPSYWSFVLFFSFIGLVVSYLLFIKAGLADYLVSFFEENFSKKLVFINYIYVFTIDILSILLLVNSLPKLL